MSNQQYPEEPIMQRASSTSDRYDGKIIQLRVIALETLYLSEIGFTYSLRETL